MADDTNGDDNGHGKSISNLRIAIIGVGLMAAGCFGHTIVQVIQAWRGGPVIAPVSAAPMAYTCGAPDDMGFTKCRRLSP